MLSADLNRTKILIWDQSVVKHQKSNVWTKVYDLDVNDGEAVDMPQIFHFVNLIGQIPSE